MTRESYIGIDGFDHWPDAEVGDDCEFGVNWGDWLTAENDTRDDLTWEVPTGVTETATRIDGNIAIIQFVVDSAGTHKFRSVLECTDGAVSQVKHKTVYLIAK